MSYKTYITEALVCGSQLRNTSDKSYLLFTRDAGMFFASAKSVREERSKQRYALQEFSYIRVTLVRGKSGWRVTGTEPIINVYAIRETREARALIRNVVRLLRRLIQGEVPHEILFDEVRTVLCRPHEGNEEAIENVLTLRMLNMLGYVAPTKEIEEISAPTSIESVAASLDPRTKELRTEIIKQALAESHL